MKAVIASLILLLLCPSVFATCKTTDYTQAELLSTIGRKTTSETDLIAAISKLKMPAEESPQYWSRIANDSGYSDFHRRCAVFQLFRRHVHAGMRLSELASALDAPTWLHENDIRSIDALFGWIPIDLNFTDTDFLVRVRPTPQGHIWCICMRITGRIDAKSFKNPILGADKKSDIGNATIAEFAIVNSEGSVLDQVPSHRLHKQAEPSVAEWDLDYPLHSADSQK